ncbi:MAG: flavodoxin domain-containing protein [Chloroflexota bacterium]|nr:flavodoxin domain-containing protein [Chloroflexota bacterium]
MTPKILIAYGTRAASTHEIADFMAAALRETGAVVDVIAITKAQPALDLRGYDRVIIGSATRIAKPLPEVVQFVRAHQAALRAIPTAYFIVCMTLVDNTPAKRAIVRTYLDPLVALHTPDSIGMFAGRFDPALIEQPWRFLMQHGGKADIPRGDFRNWDAIHAWTLALLADTRVLA